MPSEDELPVDPSSQAPRGYDEDQRGKPGGFIGDPDVMDTWATSSLTPLLVAQGARDPRVNKAESDQIVEALRRRGVDVQYIVKDNEGHGFANEENRFEAYRAIEQRLAEPGPIEQALEKTSGNLKEAAKLLGVTFRTLRYRMQRLGIRITRKISTT
mgnify:CR=1 FL=1